ETLHDDLLGSAGTPLAVSRAWRDTHRKLFGRGTEKIRRGGRAPLAPMTLPERVKADYDTMNLTTGPHPMKLLRETLPNIWRAIDLVHARHGSIIQIAGNVICRQRPGSAKRAPTTPILPRDAARAFSARSVFRLVLSRAPSTQYEKRRACRYAHKCARQRSRVALAAGLPVIERSGNYRSKLVRPKTRAQEPDV